jgi:hypothetical protein
MNGAQSMIDTFVVGAQGDSTYRYCGLEEGADADFDSQMAEAERIGYASSSWI